MATGLVFPVLDPPVPLVQAASSIAMAAAVTRPDPRRAGHMTQVCQRSLLPGHAHIPQHERECQASNGAKLGRREGGKGGGGEGRGGERGGERGGRGEEGRGAEGERRKGKNAASIKRDST